MRNIPILLLLFLLLTKPSSAANLPPVITSQPANQTVLLKATASFQVVVSSLSALSYQWYKDGVKISGANSSICTIKNVQLDDQGIYSVNITNAGGWAVSSDATLTVLGDSANSAPLLDATKHPTLTSEDEDAGQPFGAMGTLISQLVDFASPAGQLDNVMDTDNSPLLGIAVTDADTNHGTWWFSTNDGTNWNALGPVSDLNARLLAVDPDTRIYFKPDTNWNGTLTNAIAFRAWDQSGGMNGGTAVARSSGDMLDTFSVVSYGNNDGSDKWNCGWVDTDGSTSSGSIVVVNSTEKLELAANNSNDWIYREANLSGVDSVEISFDYDSNLNSASGGRVEFQVSANGGTTYSSLLTFTPTNNFGVGNFSADISPYATANTRIRFRISGKSIPTRRVDIDNVRISFISSSSGGNSAFSTNKESASLTVNPVNDPPVASSQNIITADGAPKLITLGGNDPDNNPLIFSIISAPTNGFLSGLNATNGSVTYNPGTNFTGADSFTFTVSDGATSSTATMVGITVTPVAPGVITPPQAQAVSLGQAVSFSVVAGGTKPIGYQWRLNGTNLTGATTSMLQITNAQMASAGNYSVVVTNIAGSVTSMAALLTVVPAYPPTIGAPHITATGFDFQLSLPSGATYIIFASTNLLDWISISTNVSSTTNVLVTDPSATNFTRRFYRAMVR